MDTIERKYMARCLQLAQLGVSYTSPNPLVGCVIVHNDKIIGEGFHRVYGGAHAEPDAIRSVKNLELLPESTLYVNLEPCSHFGKTPPCANLIVKHKIKRVVIATRDPNPKVSGKGIQILEQAGIEVHVGLMETEARELNKRFYTFQEEERPYVTIKWAETADGFMDKIRANHTTPALAISNSVTRQLTHRMRTENSAIMVSTNTVLLDNPSLSVRFWSGRNPIRVILDRTGKIPANFNIKDKQINTYIFTQQPEKSDNNLHFIAPDFDFYDIQNILKKLYEFRIDSVLIEGGASLLNSIIQAGCWDEANVETASFSIGDGVKAPHLIEAQLEYVHKIEGHYWRHYRKVRSSD